MYLKSTIIAVYNYNVMCTCVSSLQEDGPNMTFDGAQKKCKEAVKDFAKIQLVYGKAGLLPSYMHNPQIELCMLLCV